MNLRLIREPSRGGATLGALYMDGVWACWTLEDAIREQKGQLVSAWKVPGQTAIPQGLYRVILTPSPKFQRVLPLIVDVPGFEGVRVHPGNGPADTDGCILVGTNRGDARITESVAAFDRLFDKLKVAPGEIWIAVENPFTVAGQAA